MIELALTTALSLSPISITNNSSRISKIQMLTIRKVAKDYSRFVCGIYGIPVSKLSVFLEDNWKYLKDPDTLGLHYVEDGVNYIVVDVARVLANNNPKQKRPYIPISIYEVLTHELAEALVSPYGNNEIADDFVGQHFILDGVRVSQFRLPVEFLGGRDRL